jgi:hypothetical protein
MKGELVQAVAELEQALLEVKKAKLLARLGAAAVSRALGGRPPPAAPAAFAPQLTPATWTPRSALQLRPPRPGNRGPATTSPASTAGERCRCPPPPAHQPSAARGTRTPPHLRAPAPHRRFRYTDGRWYHGRVQAGSSAGITVHFQHPTR